MTDESHAAGSTRLLTVDAVLTAHEQLLAAQGEREDLAQIRSFVDALTQSGAYFDEASERKAIQGTLDYWTSELARHQTDEEPAGQRRRAIREFNAEALKALHFDNPFAGIADVIGSLPLEERNSAAILQVVDKTAKAGNLRFQEGLLKELVSQITGSPEDATLLEFCLWHLFEDPETRSGNKIYRPKKSRNNGERVDYFSCKVFLIQKAEELGGATLPRAERHALIGALMSMSRSNGEALRPRSRLRFIAAKLIDIIGFVQARVRSTSSDPLQFALYERKPLTLEQFLDRSRLAFWRDGKRSIVHPALTERWDRLQRRRWQLEQRQKRAETLVVALLVAVGTSLAWFAWNLVWTDLTMDHLAKAEASSTSKERLSESVKALLASKLSIGVDKSYARQVANDAIGAVIGEHANQKGGLGRLPAYPSVPAIECDRVPLFSGSDSYSAKITSDFAPPATLENLEACPIFAASLDGTLLAAAWEKRNGVNIKVFSLSPDFKLGSGNNGTLVEADLQEVDAPWMKTKPLKLARLLREESKKRGATPCKDRSLRFSQDNRIVTFECLYSGASGNELEWIPLALEGTSSDPAYRVSGNTLKDVQELAELKKAASIFLASRSQPKLGFVTVDGDGYVRIWREGKNHLSSIAEDRSDFIRIGTSGRPTAFNVEDAGDAPVYAIYALNPYPVIRVYEQRHAKHAKLLMEHYPPNGVGTPIGMEFRAKAGCLKILAKRKEAGGLELVDYYLILDPGRLRAVGKALSQDLELEPSTTGLPKYREAIAEQCAP